MKKTCCRYFPLLFVGFLVCNYAQAANIVVNSTQTVNPFADDGLCTLPEAVNAGNSNLASGLMPGECVAGEPHPQADNILFDVNILPAVFTVESALQLSETVSIIGQHKELVMIGGIGMDRIMEINGLPGHEFEFKDLTITGGYAPVGTPPISMGGGMMVSLNDSSLHIERLRFENNNAEYAGGAMAIAYGGTQNNITTIVQTEFISNQSIGSVTQANDNQGGGGAVFIGGYQTVEIRQSTFADNEAGNFIAPLPSGDGMGGAIWVLSSSSLAGSTLEIDSSTFDNNSANGVGGALAVGGPGFPSDYSQVDIKHSTFIANKADNNESDTASAGGGIYSSASTPVNIFNNVIARNRDLSATNSRPNLSGQFNTFGHNFINGNAGISVDFPMGSPNVNDDFVVPVAGTPGLMPLDDNGGPTLTRAIDIGSPLIDQGKCGNAFTDQRGFYNANTSTRANDDPDVINFVDGCDIGAYETGTVSENIEPEVGQELYTILEDTILTVTDVDGTLTPAIESDNGLLANDIDADPLWVTTAGVVDMQSINMAIPGVIDLKANGLFTYTPAANENGFAFDQYTVSDQFNQQTILFGIDVTPVNDAPHFVVEGSHYFNFSDLTPPVDEQCAIEISPGADNEFEQTLTFDLVYSQGDDSFFEVVPSIDSGTGILPFEVSDSAEGTVEMQVFLSDDGGTDNGGVDISTGETITFSRTLSDVIFKNSFESPGN